MILKLIVSVIIGLIAGTIYGLSFVAQQKRVFSSRSQKSHFNMHTLLFFFLRILFLIGGGYYLLRLPSNHFILNIVISSFVVSFWLVILKQKG